MSLLVAALLSAALVLVAVPGEASQQTEALVTALHVHSQFSTGTLSIEELATEAERLGIQAIVLSDNFVLRYEYGIFPLRGVIRRRVSLPSVLDHGVDRYLAEIATVQKKHPGVLLVPGVEVTPHYYWTGSLSGKDLTMHNSQRNLLVIGLDRAEDYRTLPLPGLPASRRMGWEVMLNLSPVLLLFPAVALWRRGKAETAVLEGMSHRYRTSALILSGVAVVLLLNARPFGEPEFSFYEPRFDYQPYQRVIDAVAARGGLTIWSMPEARDFNRYEVGPLGTITVMTDPYPQALILTSGYTAFGGLYEDTRSAVRPGGIWDQVINLYLAGERTLPPFLTGESAFHGPGEDKKYLDRVVTVVQVRERTAAGLLEGLRAGRLYAVERYKKEFGLRLDRFQVECHGGQRTAESGQTLVPEGAHEVAVRVAVSTTDDKAHPVSLAIIRSGLVVAEVTGETPLSYDFTDVEVPPGQWHAYRLHVHDRQAGELLSNPIFVGPVPAVAVSQG
jgi:hypothetical protein